MPSRGATLLKYDGCPHLIRISPRAISNVWFLRPLCIYYHLSLKSANLSPVAFLLSLGLSVPRSLIASSIENSVSYNAFYIISCMSKRLLWQYYVLFPNREWSINPSLDGRADGDKGRWRRSLIPIGHSETSAVMEMAWIRSGFVHLPAIRGS